MVKFGGASQCVEGGNSYFLSVSVAKGNKCIVWQRAISWIKGVSVTFV